MKRENIIFILSAPSGCGKSTLTKNILLQDSNIELSISLTTRKPRDNEVHGKDYFFVDTEQFSKLILNHQLIEHTNMFGNMYGINKEILEKQLSMEKDIIMNLTYHGVKILQEYKPKNVVTIFIFPPSFNELKKRLQYREHLTEEIEKRLHTYKQEISYAHTYDYVVINQVLEDTSKTIQNIINAERHKTIRIKDLIR